MQADEETAAPARRGWLALPQPWRSLLFLVGLASGASAQSGPGGVPASTPTRWHSACPTWTRSTAETVALLSAMAVDDACAESLFFNLIDLPPMSPEDEAAVARFLGPQTPPQVLVVAIEAFRGTRSGSVLRRLQSLAADKDVFVALRASYVLLRFQKDDSGFLRLRSALLSPATPKRDREALADAFDTFLPVLTRDVLGAYVDLLADSDVWIRYRAFHVLNRLTGLSFGYRYRDIPRQTAPGGARADWTRWLEALPEHWQPPAPKGPRGFVGIHVAQEPGGRIILSRVAEQSPAARAGLKAGDELQEIDGDPVDGKAVDLILAYELRPDVEGTQVVLRVRDPGTGGGGRVVVLTRERRGVCLMDDGGLIPLCTSEIGPRYAVHPCVGDDSRVAHCAIREPSAPIR